MNKRPEQCAVIKFLWQERSITDVVQLKLQAVDEDDACTFSSTCEWIYQFKTDRKDIFDDCQFLGYYHTIVVEWLPQNVTFNSQCFCNVIIINLANHIFLQGV
jgi:hypothetical protein